MQLDLFPTWLAKCSCREYQARHVVPNPIIVNFGVEKMPCLLIFSEFSFVCPPLFCNVLLGSAQHLDVMALAMCPENTLHIEGLCETVIVAVQPCADFLLYHLKSPLAYVSICFSLFLGTVLHELRPARVNILYVVWHVESQ